MTKRSWWIVALLMLCSPSFAAPLVEIEQLFTQRRFYDVTHRATALIDGGTLIGKDLGHAHLFRGKSLRHRWRPAAAFADFQTAYALLPQSADAAYWLGYAHAYGFSGKQDVTLAQSLLQKASDGGMADADYQIGYLLRESPDSKGMAFLERAASKGVPIALNTLGRMYASGQGQPRDPQLAAAQYRQAATLGDVQGEYLLGLAYCDGFGVERDPAACRSWIERAVAQGYAPAHLTLGNLLEQQTDPRVVQHHYWMAAEGGVPGGMVNIGLAYMRGHGITQDWREALTWLHRAHGIPMADYYAATMYLYGMGIEPNDAEARAALERASRAMPQATGLLAAMHAGGLGVTKNPQRAEELLTQTLASNDPSPLNEAAWLIATAPRVELRQPEMALRLAQKSVELAPSWQNLDTLAASHAVSGSFKAAIAAQERAVQLSPEANRSDLQSRLSLYREGRFWTGPLLERSEPWRGEPKRKHVATFTGEVVQLWQGFPTQQQPGYSIEGEVGFAIRVVVESVEKGELPKAMQESSVFYIHSPTQFFAPLRENIPVFRGPDGPRRYVLTEVEGNGWQFDLTVEPLRQASAP